MAAAIRVTSTGGQEIERQLAKLGEAFGDLSDLMADLGMILESSTLDRFDTESAPDGSKWTPSIRARQGGGKTLTDSSQLRSSIHSIPSAKSVEVGTNKVYAGVHQHGATIRAKNAPFLMFPLPGGLGLRKVKEVEIPAVVAP